MHNSLLFVCCVSAITTAPLRADDAAVKTLAQHIHDNDALYRNLEVRYTTLLKGLFLPEGQDPGTRIRTFRIDWRVVWQNRCYYIHRQEHLERYDGSVSDYATEMAYNGNASRANGQNVVGNISDERLSMKPACAPQRLGMLTFAECDLGAIMEGRQDFVEDTGLTVKTALLGPDKWEGVDAEKLEIKMFRRTGEMSRRLICWILPTRNYLVARMEDYFPTTNPTSPLHIIETADWRQVAPGMWAPFRAVEKNFDQIRWTESKQLVQDVEQTITVHSVKFDPHYDSQFFSDVKMPPGGMVYVFKGGEVVDTLVDGESVKKRSGALSRMAWWLIAINVTAGILIIAYVVRRRRRKRAAIASPT